MSHHSRTKDAGVSSSGRPDHRFTEPRSRAMVDHRAAGSDRPASDQALGEGGARFRFMADAVPVMIWLTGSDQKATWFNAQWLQFTGRPLQLELGFGWTDRVHPDDIERCLDTYTTCFEARRPFALEYRLLRHDGEYRWILANGVPIESGERFEGYIGSGLDITDRKHASEASAYLAAIVASSDDAIISKDLNGIIRSCNATVERVFGYAPAELIGQPVRILIPADRQQEEDVILAKIRRGERIDHFETRRVRKDGRLIDVSLTVSPVHDSTGRIIGVSKTARDITDRKRAAAEIAAQQQWFRVTLGSIGDAVIACDPQSRVTYMNATAEALTGWPHAEAEGRLLAEVFPVVNEKSGRPAPNPATLVMRQGQTVNMANSTLLISRDGTRRPIDDSAAPIRARDGEIIGMVLVFRDVTERRRIEAERQQAAGDRERMFEAERAARAEAERANRVKDEFVAMVSHELRTPLNAILGWTELMRSAPSDLAILERGVDVISRNTRAQAQLIADLLDISRIVSGKLALEIQSVDLGDIVADAVETVEREAAQKQIDLTVTADEHVGPVAGDPTRLQQAVWNLLANAVKFTPEGGGIRVSLTQSAGMAEIGVADTGAGIRADVLPHVFDRFHQADRSITRRFGGLGLGLSIVKHVVELHGGSVQAESPGEGGGARFTIRVPVATRLQPQPAQAAAVVDMAPPVSLDGLRVLLVEDEPDTLEFLRRLLQSHGAHVVTAATADDALARFREARPELLISDVGLPQRDGYELIQLIRREDNATHPMPAIALTAYARSEDRLRALRAGFHAHIAKPAEPAELLATAAGLAKLRNRHRRP